MTTQAPPITRIRPLTAEDASIVQLMATRFLSREGPYGERFAADPTCIAALAQRFLVDPTCLCLIAERDGHPFGMFGAFYFQHPITGERVASELCWWIEPEFRGGRVALQMLRLVETWAREQGAVAFEMIAPDERVAEFYGRLGYARADVHYRTAL